MALMWMGIFNLVLVALNNVLYYSKPWLVALLLVQNITLLSFFALDFFDQYWNV
jgi:hypothetical protein